MKDEGWRIENKVCWMEGGREGWRWRMKYVGWRIKGGRWRMYEGG